MSSANPPNDPSRSAQPPNPGLSAPASQGDNGSTLDPFYEILGIRSADGPPDHYKLLGIEPNESLPRVIERAADRQMGFARGLQQTDPKGATTVLNALARARRCLLDPAQKAKYDAQLAAATAPAPHAPAPPAEQPPAAPVVQPAPQPSEPDDLFVAPQIRTSGNFLANTRPTNRQQPFVAPQIRAADPPAVDEPSSVTISVDAEANSLHSRIAPTHHRPSPFDAVQSWFRDYPIAAFGSVAAVALGFLLILVLVLTTGGPNSEASPPEKDPLEEEIQPIVPPVVPPVDPPPAGISWDENTEITTQTLEGHTDQVRCVAISPDGERIVSGSWDRTIKIWNTHTGQLERTLEGHSNWVHCVSISPDGRWIASGSKDKSLKIWNAQTGELDRTLEGHEEDVYCVSFSPNSQQIVSGSVDDTIKIWNTHTGALVRTLTGHAENVRSVSFSPDGNLILSGSNDHTIKLWNAKTGALVHTLTGHTSGVTGVSISPNGLLIASGSWDNSLKVWDLHTGNLERTIAGRSHALRSVAFSPDGEQIASGGENSTLKIWSAQTGELVRNIENHGKKVLGVAFSPDGRQIVSGSADKTIRIWTNTSIPEPAPPVGAREDTAATRIQAGEWFDLMPHIIADHHVVAGTWNVQEVSINTDATRASRIALPVKLDNCSYEVSIQFVRTSGNDAIAMNIPVGQHSASIVLNGWPHLEGRSHLELINGHFPDRHEDAVRGMLIRNHQLHTCNARVDLLPNDEVHISVHLDGSELFSWSGRQSALSTSRAWSLPDNACLGLGAFESATTFEEVKVRLISGEPTLVGESNLEEETGSHSIEDETGVEPRSALHFNGRQALETGIEWSGGPMTVEAVVTPEVLGYDTLVGDLEIAGFQLSLWQSHYHFRIRRTGSAFVHISSGNPVVLGETAHVAAVFDGRNLGLYVNGVLQSTTSIPDGHQVHPCTRGIYVGAEPGSVGINRYYTGNMESVMISRGVRYTRDFTPSDDLAAGIDSDNIVLHLDFREGPDEGLVDRSPQGHTITPIGDPTFVEIDSE